MKQLAHYILTTFFLTLSHLTFACTCGSAGQFLTVAPKTELVSLVKVIKYLTFKVNYDKQTPMSMEVEIIKTFKGDETRKSIVVWGDNGALCRPYLSQFDTGKYYVIAFYKGYDGSQGYVHSDEKTSDYSISSCGKYWLTANIETKMANGSVSSTQSSISFDELWEQFHGDKTKELKPNDFKEIYQLAFDLPELQQYYHIETDTTRKQIIIQYFGEADHNNLKGVIKFGRQVQILSEEEIKKRNLTSYFVLGDWVCGLNSVRLQLSYVVEGLTASYMFKKVNDKWTILSHDISEG
jgi:hypothetical protein